MQFLDELYLFFREFRSCNGYNGDVEVGRFSFGPKLGYANDLSTMSRGYSWTTFKWDINMCL